MRNPRMMRILAGDYTTGCRGQHFGKGTSECPRELHHHHDEFCAPHNEEEKKVIENAAKSS